MDDKNKVWCSVENHPTFALRTWGTPAGVDPCFVNVSSPDDPASQNVPWLSQDLSVFTATPAQPAALVLSGDPEDVEEGQKGK